MRFNTITFSTLAVLFLLLGAFTTPTWGADTSDDDVPVAEAEAIADSIKDTPLPKRAAKILDDFHDDYDKIIDEYVEDVERAKASTIRDLEREVKSLTRRGELEEALVVKTAVEEIKNTHAKSFFGDAITDPSAGERIRDLLVGRVARRTTLAGDYTFNSDGTVKYVQPGKSATARWAVAPGDSGVFIIWDNAKWWDRIHFDAKDPDKLIMTNCAGDHWELEVVEPEKGQK